MNFDYIAQGDCLELMKDIPDGSIDLIVTDPPYKIVAGGCTNKGNMATTGVLSRNTDAVKKGELFEHNKIKFAEWIPQAYRVLKETAHCYIMVNGRNLCELQSECDKAGFIYQNLLVWNKGNLTPNKWYMNQCEFILMLRKGKAKNINNMGTSTLLNVPNIIGKKSHPTEKPTDLIAIFIENSSNPGDIVLDLFLGSGTTAVAAVNTNRHYIGFELDEKYFDIACKRLDEAEEKAGVLV